MFTTAARRAAMDATPGSTSILRDCVAIASPGMFLEQRFFAQTKRRQYKNFSRSVANALGASPLPENTIRSYPGGNSPQFLMSMFAEKISKGEVPQGPILIGGVEENSTFDRAVRAGRLEELLSVVGPGGGRWCDSSSDAVEESVVVNKHKSNDPELRTLLASQFYHVGSPPAMYIYPMFENAYANSHGRTADEQLPRCADLFSRFSVVAAAQPQHSWYPQERTKEWLMHASDQNRIFGYPYRKWMCARDEVDQSAVFIVMSWAEAERRGVHPDKLVFLHGSGDAFDEDVLPLRHQFDASLSMKVAYDEAFRSAGLGAVADESKVAFFDIYSCFPIAVEQACECVGLDPLTADVSRLTLTGGLPYHGGPGSNYSAHGICAVVEKLRLAQYRGQYGVVGANGGWLSEHSVGVYSTKPPKGIYHRRDYTCYGTDYGLPMSMHALAPSGRAKILTWTVRYERRSLSPELGVIIGELVEGPGKGKRFFANSVKGDMRACSWLIAGNRIGSLVRVFTETSQSIKFGKRTFSPCKFQLLEANSSL
eukprot:g1486.t1